MTRAISLKGRLLVFSGYWPTAENSISGIFVVQQVAALSRLGYQVTVILPTTIGRGGARPYSVAAMGLDASMVKLIQIGVLRLPEKLSSLPGAIKLNVELCGRMLAAKISRLSAEMRFDGCIIHAPRYVGLSLPWWQRYVHGSTVIVMHGEEPFLTRPRNVRCAEPLFVVAANSASAFVLVGSRLKAHALSLGIPEAKIQVVPNGTDCPEADTVSDTQRPVSEPRRILSVSNLVPLKGIDDNLRALAMISNNRPDLAWEYRVVGDGSHRTELESLAEVLQISDRVQFLGRLSYSDTMREMNAADIFSLPSWNEAFGIVYLEAMSRMKPVIGCLENGAAEIVTDSENGLLIPPQSVIHLVAALERLIGDPKMCQEMGRSARRTASNYSWEKNAQRMIDLLAQLPPVTNEN
jgi:glycosyltransferase involved in cell wall biosynthesis